MAQAVGGLWDALAGLVALDYDVQSSAKPHHAHVASTARGPGDATLRMPPARFVPADRQCPSLVRHRHGRRIAAATRAQHPLCAGMLVALLGLVRSIRALRVHSSLSMAALLVSTTL